MFEGQFFIICKVFPNCEKGDFWNELNKIIYPFYPLLFFRF